MRLAAISSLIVRSLRTMNPTPLNTLPGDGGQIHILEYYRSARSLRQKSKRKISLTEGNPLTQTLPLQGREESPPLLDTEDHLDVEGNLSLARADRSRRSAAGRRSLKIKRPHDREKPT